VIALGTWAAARLTGVGGAERDLARFAIAQASGVSASQLPDQRLWSPERVRAFRASMNRDAPPPLAVLRVPRLEVSVPVLEGTDEWTLNRAVGHIEDTAAPGTDGNVGIAGHRDGFFRALKDIRVGDEIEIETLTRVLRYQVERAWVVGPDDVTVLDDTAAPTITLVTCYPFYFIGPAPQRFIVRATRTASGPRQKAPA